MLIVAVTLAAVFSRPLRAWWDDDAGNRALLAGKPQVAIAWFDAGLRAQPDWALLHEDRGRALLNANPTAALAEFERAACGSPCLAEEGDALAALGRLDEATQRYVSAKAVGRASVVAMRLASHGKYDAALAIESALIERLHDDFVDRSDLASAYAAIGKIQTAAASSGDVRAPGERGALAIAAFSRATSLAPLNEDYLLSYGFAELRWGSPRAARAAFERLLQIHPHQPDAQAALQHMGSVPTGTP